jgi:hypothetical protein
MPSSPAAAGLHPVEASYADTRFVLLLEENTISIIIHKTYSITSNSRSITVTI